MKSSMDNFETAQAKTLALKSSLENVPFNLNNIDEENLSYSDEDELAKETSESMKVFELYHFVMAKFVSALQKFNVVSLRSQSLPLGKNSCKLPKSELPKFSGNLVY